MTLTNGSCKRLEKDTVGHYESKLWVFSVARKINASNSQKVFKRKKIFETLVPSFLNEEQKSTSINQKKKKKIQNMSNGTFTLKFFNLNKNADVRETRRVIQPLCPG